MNEWLRPTSLKRKIFFMGADFLLSLFTLFFAYELRFNFHIEAKFFDSFWLVFLVLFTVKVLALMAWRAYAVVWRFFSFSDAKNLIKAHLLAYGAFVLLYLLWGEIFNPFPRSVIIIDFFLSLIFIGAFRVSKRVLIEGQDNSQLKPTLLIGVNSKTATMIQSALKNEIPYYPVGIVSLKENESTTHAYINNVKVYLLQELSALVREKQITSAIITEALTQEELKRLVDQLNALGIYEIKQVKLLGGEHEKLEDLSIEDLLARHPKDLDLERISSFIKNKSVLITGAGGSIGSEISRQCRNTLGRPPLILVLDNSEYNLYQIGEQIEDASIKVDIGDRQRETLISCIARSAAGHSYTCRSV